jgi:hypothetical protein
MTALTDLSDLINKATGGNSGTPENLFFYKSQRIAGAAATAPIAGRPASLWLYDGLPGAGVAPGAVAIPTVATAGALGQVNPGGGRQKLLYSIWATGLVAGTLILYDRLLHQSNLSGTTATAQTVQGTGSPTPALTRYTNGIGNIVFAEIYTILGATTSSIVMSYTDQADNVTTSPSVLFGNTNYREVTRAIMLPLASGDTGVKTVRTVTHATTGTAGAYGITIGHPLATLSAGSGSAGWRDFTTGLPGIPEILTDACLAFLWVPNNTTIPELFGGLSMLES